MKKKNQTVLSKVDIFYASLAFEASIAITAVFCIIDDCSKFNAFPIKNVRVGSERVKISKAFRIIQFNFQTLTGALFIPQCSVGFLKKSVFVRMFLVLVLLENVEVTKIS